MQTTFLNTSNCYDSFPMKRPPLPCMNVSSSNFTCIIERANTLISHLLHLCQHQHRAISERDFIDYYKAMSSFAAHNSSLISHEPLYSPHSACASDIVLLEFTQKSSQKPGAPFQLISASHSPFSLYLFQYPAKLWRELYRVLKGRVTTMVSFVLVTTQFSFFTLTYFAHALIFTSLFFCFLSMMYALLIFIRTWHVLTFIQLHFDLPASTIYVWMTIMMAWRSI
jgi:hypothetical protein